MNAVDRLKRDHGILRSKLDVLETALEMGPQTWYVLREVSFTLAKQLRDHIRREEELIALCRKVMIPALGASPEAGSGRSGRVTAKGMDPKTLAEVSLEHHDEPEHLRSINRMFVTESTHSMDRLRPALQRVIEGLRHHMVEEERELFPVLERVLEQAMPGRPETWAMPINETMTVNRIIRDFPRTQQVFEQLFINVPVEGCTCLDEVAWRHGMEAKDLLKLLDEAVRTCELAKRDAPATEPVGTGVELSAA